MFKAEILLNTHTQQHVLSIRGSKLNLTDSTPSSSSIHLSRSRRRQQFHYFSMLARLGLAMHNYVSQPTAQTLNKEIFFMNCILDETFTHTLAQRQSTDFPICGVLFRFTLLTQRAKSRLMQCNAIFICTEMCVTTKMFGMAQSIIVSTPHVLCIMCYVSTIRI